MKLDVLVTDCETKHGYAIAVSLVKRGLKVQAHFNKKANPYYFSRLLKHKVCFPLKKKDDIKWLVQHIGHYLPDVLIPVSNGSVKLISENRRLLSPDIRYLLPEEDKVRLAQDKRATFKYAESIQVRSPRTIYDTTDPAFVKQKLESFTFPVVLKFVNVGETGVRYCNNTKDVLECLKPYITEQSLQPPVIQEYIEGRGAGYYGLYKNGVCIYDYTHQRLHEYPVTGGSSTYAVSTHNEELKDIGRNILSSLEWNGVAMVEFKETGEGELVLMEINPKFWGSYALSESIGLSFAYDYYLLAKGETVAAKSYLGNIGYKWVAQNWLYMRDSLFSGRNHSYGASEKVKVVHNDFTLKDPVVLAFKIADGLIRLISKKVNPHSKAVNKG